MKSKFISLCAGATLALGLSAAAEAAQQPNFYECIGKNANLTLSVGSKAEVGIMPAQTTLNLQVGEKRYSFQQAEIVTESTLIGELWEVALAQVPDLYIEHASVVIPTIYLDTAPINFKSQLILTKVSTPLSDKALLGVVNASKYIDLSCTASTVYY